MKIAVRIVFLLMVAATVLLYIAVPKNIEIKVASSINAPALRVAGFLNNPVAWKKWWPMEQRMNDTSFRYGKGQYTITVFSENIVGIRTIIDHYAVSGEATVAASAADSSIVEWVNHIETGNNLFKKLKWYFAAPLLKTDMSNLLASLKTYLDKKENIYGMDIRLEKVKDTVLITLKTVLPNYPTTSDIYSMVDRLKSYIQLQHAQETNFPMLHVVRKNSAHFETQVAIPTDHALPSNDSFILKRMFAGKILVAEIKGGPAYIANAFNQLEDYRSDNNLASPAIPFSVLVTDRRKESDTSQWVTRLYYPIF